MRRSKSIRGLHLSGNPGITPRLIDYLSERAQCVQDSKNYFDVSKCPSHVEAKNIRSPRED